MAYDPTQDPGFGTLSDDIFAGIKGAGGGGGVRAPISPSPGPTFNFGYGLSGGPTFGAGTSTGLRRRFGEPMSSATVGGSGINRYAQPAFAGGGSHPGFFPSSAPQSGGYGTNVYGQAMGPDFLNQMFQQNALGANGMDFAMLGQLGLAGGFDPMGSAPLVEMLRQQIMNSTRANESSARTNALFNSGSDPLMQAQAALGAQLGGANAQSSALSNARLQSALQNQQFLQALSQMLIGGERDVKSAIHLQRVGKDIQGKPGFGDFLGDLFGVGVGSLAGGWGNALGGG